MYRLHGAQKSPMSHKDLKNGYFLFKIVGMYEDNTVEAANNFNTSLATCMKSIDKQFI
jgi:hypothetical protein